MEYNNSSSISSSWTCTTCFETMNIFHRADHLASKAHFRKDPQYQARKSKPSESLPSEPTIPDFLMWHCEFCDDRMNVFHRAEHLAKDSHAKALRKQGITAGDLNPEPVIIDGDTVAAKTSSSTPGIVDNHLASQPEVNTVTSACFQPTFDPTAQLANSSQVRFPCGICDALVPLVVVASHLASSPRWQCSKCVRSIHSDWKQKHLETCKNDDSATSEFLVVQDNLEAVERTNSPGVMDSQADQLDTKRKATFTAREQDQPKESAGNINIVVGHSDDQQGLGLESGFKVDDRSVAQELSPLPNEHSTQRVEQQNTSIKSSHPIIPEIGAPPIVAEPWYCEICEKSMDYGAKHPHLNGKKHSSAKRLREREAANIVSRSTLDKNGRLPLKKDLGPELTRMLEDGQELLSGSTDPAVQQRAVPLFKTTRYKGIRCWVEEVQRRALIASCEQDEVIVQSELVKTGSMEPVVVASGVMCVDEPWRCDLYGTAVSEGLKDIHVGGGKYRRREKAKKQEVKAKQEQENKQKELEKREQEESQVKLQKQLQKEIQRQEEKELELQWTQEQQRKLDDNQRQQEKLKQQLQPLGKNKGNNEWECTICARTMATNTRDGHLAGQKHLKQEKLKQLEQLRK